MKILMISHEFIGTGSGNTCYYLSRELAKLGIGVDVVTSSFARLKREMRDDVNVYRVFSCKQYIDSSTLLDVILFAVTSCIYALKLFITKKHNVIHCFFALPAGLVGYFLKKLLNVPYVIRLGGGVPFWDPYKFRVLSKFVLPIFKIICKNAAVLIVNSRALKNYLQKILNSNLYVICNGVDSNRFRPMTHAGAIEKRVLCVSRLAKVKGIDYLIKAVSSLEECQLLIIGDGSERQTLENLTRNLSIESRVKFLGQVKYEEIHRYYRQADIFVLSSLRESMSNSVLEAISSGLPLILTNVGDNEKVFNQNSIVVPVKDVEALREALSTLFKNNQMRIKMGEKSRELAIKRFNWCKVAERYLSIYNDIAS